MRILTGQGRTRDRTGQDKEQKGEHGTMRINYVITSKEQQCDYFALLQAFGVPEDTEDHSVCALQIYDFEPDDLMNDITDFQVKGSHRAIDEDGIPFDVIVLVSNRLHLKRDLIFRNGKLYLSGFYGRDIDHISDEYMFIDRD